MARRRRSPHCCTRTSCPACWRGGHDSTVFVSRRRPSRGEPVEGPQAPPESVATFRSPGMPPRFCRSMARVQVFQPGCIVLARSGKASGSVMAKRSFFCWTRRPINVAVMDFVHDPRCHRSFSVAFVVIPALAHAHDPARLDHPWTSRSPPRGPVPHGRWAMGARTVARELPARGRVLGLDPRPAAGSIPRRRVAP